MTPLGQGANATWEALRRGVRGVRSVAVPPGLAPGLGLTASIDRPYLRMPVPEEQESQAKFLNSAGELAATVVHEALQSAHAEGAKATAAQRGLFIAQNDFSRAGCQDFRGAVVDATQALTAPLDREALNKASLHKVNPFVLLETLHNNAFSFVTATFGLKGPNATLSGYEGTGLAAAGVAARAVRTGRVELGVAVGSASTSSGLLRHELATLGQLSAGPVSEAPRPFDRARDGMVVGDAAAALVMEPLEAARGRGPGPWIVVLGCAGATGPLASGALTPEPATIVQAARAALRDAGLRVAELGGVVAAGSGRRAEDGAMLAALVELLEGAPRPVASACGSLGHAASGTDVGHLLLAVHALRDGALPATLGFREPEPGTDVVQVTQARTPLAAPSLLVLACGLDGQAHALVLARAR
jgi:3-oxoacyl-[acyl-carrier-protein] synthase II